MTTDWQRWHAAYGDPSSSLSRRLDVVQRRVAHALSSGSVRSVLSLCAGDGRDVVPVLADHAHLGPVQATLVELDPTLASAATKRAADAAITVDVIVGDAGSCATWAAVAPVDLLLLCGIFGNISDEDVRQTVQHTPQLLAPGGFVIWTRGGTHHDDLRPQIREWFRLVGLREVSFEQEAEGYGVGMNQAGAAASVAGRLPARLFTFTR